MLHNFADQGSIFDETPELLWYRELAVVIVFPGGRDINVDTAALARVDLGG